MATQIKFMNERLQQELDKLWESGELSNEKLQEMQSEHLRTAYKECLRLDFLFMRNAQQVEHSAKNYLLKYFLPPCRITIPLAFLPTVIPAILKVLADFTTFVRANSVIPVPVLSSK